MDAMEPSHLLTRKSQERNSPETVFEHDHSPPSSRGDLPFVEDKGFPPRSTFKSFILVLTCTFAMIVNMAGATSVSISLSTIGRALCIQENQLQWLVSGYSLSSGCLLLVFGRFADLYGRKKTYIGGSVWLLAFTIGCGFARDSVTLNVLRGFQGLGTAATIPASLGILAEAFPPSSRERSAAFASFAAGAPVGAAMGMAIGGVLVETTATTWRTPFFLAAGLTFLCIMGGLFSIDADKPSTETDKRIDWLGAFLVTAGLVLVVFVLAQGEIAPQGWRTGYIIALLIVGVLFLVLFILWQQHLESIHYPESSKVAMESEKGLPLSTASTEDAHLPKGVNRSWISPPPLMKPSLWRKANGRLAVMMFIAFLTWCAFLAWGFWAQLYYQNFLQLSPLHTVLRLLPMFATGIICNIIVAAVVNHVPLIFLIVIGTLGSSLACLLFAVIKPSASYWAFGFPGAIVTVLGADFVFAAGTLYVAHIVEPQEQSLAGGIFQTMTQIGTSVGLTVTTVIFNRVTEHHPQPIDGTLPNPSLSDGPSCPLPSGPSNALPLPGLESYQAAQWGCFAFGILATILAIIFFRGVGVIGKAKR